MLLRPQQERNENLYRQRIVLEVAGLYSPGADVDRLFAGIDKIVHYDGFVNALRSYAAIPESFAAPLAPAVILAELWTGTGLLRRSLRQRAAWTGAAFAGNLFDGDLTIVLAVDQLAAPGSVCGCWFTLTLPESSGAHVARNLVLLALSLTLWWEIRSGARSEESSEIVHEATSAPI